MHTALLACLFLFLLLLALLLLFLAARSTSAPGALEAPPITLAFVCKNEAHVIEEFLAHHLGEGVSSVLMMDDFSTDKSVELAVQLCADARVPLILLPRRRSCAVQKEFYPLLLTLCREVRWPFLKHGWLLVADCDEFAYVRSETQRLSLAQALGATAPGLDVLGMSWLSFGTADSCPGPGQLRSMCTRRVDFDSGRTTVTLCRGACNDDLANGDLRKYCVRLAAIRSQRVKFLGVHGTDRAAEGVHVKAERDLLGDTPKILMNHYSWVCKEWYKNKVLRGDSDAFRVGALTRLMEELSQNAAVLDARRDTFLRDRFPCYGAYVISRPDAQARRAHMRSLCLRLGLRPKMVEPLRADGRAPTKSWLSLTQQHVLEDIATQRASEWHFIFEDDAQLATGCDIFRLHELLDENLDAEGLVCLGTTSTKALAFAVTPRGAVKVLGAAQRPPQLCAGFFFQDCEADQGAKSLPITTVVINPSSASFQLQLRHLRALAPELLEDLVVLFDEVQTEEAEDVLLLGRIACRRFRHVMGDLRAAMRVVETHFVYVTRADLILVKELPLRKLLQAMLQHTQLQRVELGCQLSSDSKTWSTLSVADLTFLPTQCLAHDSFVTTAEAFLEDDESLAPGTHWYLGDSLEDGGFVFEV